MMYPKKGCFWHLNVDLWCWVFPQINKGRLSSWRIHETQDLADMVQTLYKAGAHLSPPHGLADALSRLPRIVLQGVSGASCFWGAKQLQRKAGAHCRNLAAALCVCARGRAVARKFFLKRRPLLHPAAKAPWPNRPRALQPAL